MTGQGRHGRERGSSLANPEETERDRYLFPSYELCRVLCIVSHWKLRVCVWYEKKKAHKTAVSNEIAPFSLTLSLANGGPLYVRDCSHSSDNDAR